MKEVSLNRKPEMKKLFLTVGDVLYLFINTF